MSVGVFGAKALIDNLHRARKAADKAADAEVNRARLAVETDAKRFIAKGPKTGWVYHRQFDGKWMVISRVGIIGNPQVVAIYRAEGKENMSAYHQASSPGQPPATDTGTLIASIESKMETYQLTSSHKASAVVWTENDYAKFLEFGTKKIEPRPFMTPALEKNRARFPKALGEAVIKSIDGSIKKSATPAGSSSPAAAMPKKETMADVYDVWSGL